MLHLDIVGEKLSLIIGFVLVRDECVIGEKCCCGVLVTVRFNFNCAAKQTLTFFCHYGDKQNNNVQLIVVLYDFCLWPKDFHNHFLYDSCNY